jgi:hypothetical protein
MGGTMMETVLFTDQDIVVFVIIASAVALVLSVLGLQRRIRRAPTSSINCGGDNPCGSTVLWAKTSASGF